MGAAYLDLESQWSPARLIPTAGIRGNKEQEERATSSLLAVMMIVPEFGRALLSYLGAPKGRLSAFTEVKLENPEGGYRVPDAVIKVEWGKRTWAALVEVKTGNSILNAEQVDNYLSIANHYDFDGLITISNQLVADPSDVPVPVDRRRLRKLTAKHLSWFRILTEAVALSEHKKIQDTEQDRILRELVLYLDDEKSGAGGIEGMGQKWVSVRDGAKTGVLHADDSSVNEVAANWHQLAEYLGLDLRQRLGHKVTTKQPSAVDHAASLAKDGQLVATFVVPNAAGPIELKAVLPSRLIQTSVRVKAPSEGRAKTRVNWLLRQIKEVPDDLRVDVHFKNIREPLSHRLGDVRKQVDRLLYTADPRREPTAFTIIRIADMGIKNGKGRGSFIASAREQLSEFYGDVVQDLQAWVPKAPKLPEEPEIEKPAEVTTIRPNGKEQPEQEVGHRVSMPYDPDALRR